MTKKHLRKERPERMINRALRAEQAYSEENPEKTLRELLTQTRAQT